MHSPVEPRTKSIGWQRWWPLRRPSPSQNSVLLLLALAVGLATGAGVWLFKHGFEWLTEVYREPLEHLSNPVFGAFAIVPVLALGGLIVGTLRSRFVGEERHHGVAGIMEATALAGGRLRYRRMPIKTLLAALSIGAGASVGPEDPSVQVGANFGSMFGQRLRLSDERVRLLVAAGVASGIATAFQAPIAGVFFALEVILGDLSVGSFGAVVLSAVVASVFTQAAEPAGHELGIHHYRLGGPGELPLYILLGILMALVSAVFIRMLYWQHDFWHHIRLPQPVKTMLAGAIVGLIAVFVPQVMGTGRETLNELLNSNGVNYSLGILLALTAAKLLATSISLGGGFVGGMFAPSLFVGAAFGGAFGHLANQWFPGELSADPAAYAMAGMAAAMAGVIRAPITAVLLLFELTGDYNLILPIMLVTAVSLLVVGKVAPDGIYHLALARKGVRLTQGRDTDLMQTIRVSEAMSPLDGRTVRADLPALQLDNAFRARHTHGLIVVSELGELEGIITLQDLSRARSAGPLDGKTVGDLATREVITIQPDEPISRALQLIGGRDLGRLPVVDAENPRRMVGVLRRHDIIRAYDMALQRKFDASYTAGQVRLAAYSEQLVLEFHVETGAAVDGILVKDVAWPPGTLVASIRRNGQTAIPRGISAIHAGDVLTVVTTREHEVAVRTLVKTP